MGMPHFYPSARALFIPPIFFGFACDRWCFRIFDLDPKGRSPGAIGRANPFRHDAFAAELAGVFVHDVALAVVVLIEDDARARGRAIYRERDRVGSR